MLVPESGCPMLSAELSGARVDLNGGASSSPAHTVERDGGTKLVVGTRTLNLSASSPPAPSVASGPVLMGGADWMDMEDEDTNSPEPPIVGIWAKMSALRKKHGHLFSNLRPWREFFRCSWPSSDIVRRLEANLAHFRVNYACVLFLVAAFFVVANPRSLIAICLLTVLWALLLRKSDDPTWELKVANVRLSMMQQWLLLVVVSAFILLYVLGNLLTSIAFSCATVVLVHAALHSIPDSHDIIADVGTVMPDGI